MADRPDVRAEPAAELRQAEITLPETSASTDAIFILMRRMRTPLVVLLIVFAVDVFGLSLMPGVDASGAPHRMTIFDAFYVMSYTATTIGFGEIPYEFSTAQRMWVTFSIYSSVVVWAYTLGTLLGLFQDRGFREAVQLQRVTGQVRRLREPFLIIAGYGQMGQRIVETLDAQGRRVVVVDTDDHVRDQLAGGKLSIDVPAIDGDIRDPRTLTLAGLGHPYCEGVLAMTHDDAVNSAAVMAVRLLRPELPVYARANDRLTAVSMHDFGADGVINPFDRFGEYLILRLQRPVTYRLVKWLLAPYDSPLEECRTRLPSGRWLVASDDHFGEEIASDLRRAGVTVEVVDAHEPLPDLTEVAGLVAGAADENRNLALAGRARMSDPGVFLAVRACSEGLGPLLDAFSPDIVFIPSRLTAEEALARVVTPDFWEFFRFAFNQDEEWSRELLDRLLARQGTGSPMSQRFVLDETHAPGVLKWLVRHSLTLGDLLRDPDDREQPLALVPLIVTRAGVDTFAPADDFALAPGDELVVAGHDAAMDVLDRTLFHPEAVEYVATGSVVPATWLFRKLSPRVQDV